MGARRRFSHVHECGKNGGETGYSSGRGQGEGAAEGADGGGGRQYGVRDEQGGDCHNHVRPNEPQGGLAQRDICLRSAGGVETASLFDSVCVL